MMSKYDKDYLDSIRYSQMYISDSRSFKTTPLIRKPVIKKVIFNDPATIVIWDDGTKTVVKCCEGDEFDPEKGLAMAVSKKALGGSLKEVRKWTDEYYKDLDSLDKTQFEEIVRAFNKLFK